MHNLIKFYYSNKYKIWGIIVAIILVILIIQIANSMISIQNKNALNKYTQNTITQNNTSVNNSSTYFPTNESVITGEQVEETSLEKAKTIIESFVTECNDQNIEGAYNFLSEDCKKEYYQSVEKFKELYYDKNFGNTKKIVTVNNWILDTYKINITEDVLSTGKISDMQLEDYYTIVKENESLKLNINGFVEKVDINKSQTENNINFNIVSKRVFMDYEIYTIRVENKTEGNLVLDSKQDTKSIYLEDTKGSRYYVYTNELSNALLKVNKGFSTQIDIKFFKGYNSSFPQMRYMVFSDVELKNNNDGSEENKKETILINM